MSRLVAERLLRESKSGKNVVVKISAPEKIDGSSEWSCKVEVQGLENPFERSLIGVDSFQALYLGFRLVCSHLEKYEETLAFLDGQPGDAGLPLISSCPPESKAEVHNLIEEKIRASLVSRQ